MVANFIGGNFQGGDFQRGELSWVGIFIWGNFHRWQFSGGGAVYTEPLSVILDYVVLRDKSKKSHKIV